MQLGVCSTVWVEFQWFVVLGFIARALLSAECTAGVLGFNQALKVACCTFGRFEGQHYVQAATEIVEHYFNITEVTD